MAQSLYIGLYGPSIKLYVGICAICFDLKYSWFRSHDLMLGDQVIIFYNIQNQQICPWVW